MLFDPRVLAAYGKVFWRRPDLKRFIDGRGPDEEAEEVAEGEAG